VKNPPLQIKKASAAPVKTPA